ncbi:adenylate cyclase [Bradyrhizobium iriomotense]|uniref:Adenylate cyclase n=2 Tax=Bradyrhizobium iriomotense TaxID=441950 RepID=A0ABQ6B7Z5_9BRAD|nr:adenylate cyclase [Bradyrhizobium iriomotense]
METPPDEASYTASLKSFEETDSDIDHEATAAHRLIVAIIDDARTPSDRAALARIDYRIDTVVNDLRSRLNEQIALLRRELDAHEFVEVRRILSSVDALRDELNTKINDVRADMLGQVCESAKTVIRSQRRAILISAVVTAVAALLGFAFSILVGGGITRPILRLLEGTREVEAGRLDGSISVTTRDEIGELSAAFNRMIETLRRNAQVRETYGRYIDPRIAEGLLEQPALAATEGQRRVMTVMFCDMRGFTTLSEGVTPQGLVKIMNLYFSTMSEPIHAHRGIIDKYIGDAIMAYWGPPFIAEADQTDLACLAAIGMIGRVPKLCKELPELLGVRRISTECDIRIGIATGEALVGSIGSEFRMSYTVMGDTVNLAARLERANKIYGSRCLISEATAVASGATIEVREIDRVVVVGQTKPQVVFEIMGRKGELTTEQMQLQTRYAEGLAAYRERRWDDAQNAFTAALEAIPGDHPSMTFARRISCLKQKPPPADWDGSWHLEHK